jgi:hypothetical protein
MFKDKNDNCRLKIAFDFDGTLTNEVFFALAKHLILKGHDVWTVTARNTYEQYLKMCRNPYASEVVDRKEFDSWNRDLTDIAKKLGLEDKIIFTGNEVKKDFYFQHGFDLLFDDEAEWHCNPVCESGSVAVNV